MLKKNSPPGGYSGRLPKKLTKRVSFKRQFEKKTALIVKQIIPPYAMVTNHLQAPYGVYFTVSYDFW